MALQALTSLPSAAMTAVSFHRPAAVTAGAAAQLGGVIWVLQWAHVLVAHGPTSFNEAQVWLGMTWMDSAKFLSWSYLLLTPGVLYLASSMRDAGDRLAAGLGALVAVTLVVCAITTPFEFLTAQWGSYRAYVGALDPAIAVAGVVRALASSVLLAVALAVMAIRAGRRGVLPYWMAPVLVVGCMSTYFIAGPLPPVAALAWLMFGGWLLVQHVGEARRGRVRQASH